MNMRLNSLRRATILPPRRPNASQFTLRRFNGTQPSPKAPPRTSSAEERVKRLNARLPEFLRPYVSGLRSAPISQVTSFLILHELTAVAPLIGLFGIFHYTNTLPESWTDGKVVKEGAERFAKYFGKKGWISEEDRDEAVAKVRGAEEGGEKTQVMKTDGTGKGVRIVMEAAIAYALVKALLPVRILVSVWATPWFARVFMLPITKLFKRGGRKTVANGSGAAGTGAVGGGVAPKK